MTELLVIAYDGLDKPFWSQIVPESFTGKFYDYTSKYQETVQSWTSIYTGLTVEEHKYEKGWHSFLKNKKSVNRLSTVWKDINHMGKTTGLYNLPLTYPAFKVDGWVVSGFPAFPKRKAYPDHIMSYLDRHQQMVDLHRSHNQYPEDTDDLKWMRPDEQLAVTETESFQHIVTLIENRFNILDVILSENPVDVVMAGYSYLDHAGHLGFNVNGLYKNGTVNASIEMLIRICKPDKTLIVSDHGGYFWAEPQIGPRGEWEGLISIGFNHSPEAVLYLMGDEVEDKPRYEYDIKEMILEVLQ